MSIRYLVAAVAAALFLTACAAPVSDSPGGPIQESSKLLARADTAR